MQKLKMSLHMNCFEILLDMRHDLSRRMCIVDVAGRVVQVLDNDDALLLHREEIENDIERLSNRIDHTEYYDRIYETIKVFYDPNVKAEDIIVKHMNYEDNQGLFELEIILMNSDGDDIYIDDQYVVDRRPDLFKFKQIEQSSYSNDIVDVYPEYFSKGTACRNFTFQVTENCNLRCTYCQPAGTKIRMADKTTKNVEDIIAGDVVMSFDEDAEGGYPKLTKSVVVATMKHDVENMVEISIPECGDISAISLHLTPDHPVLTTDGWVDAGDLVPENMGICVHDPDSSLSNQRYHIEWATNNYTIRKYTKHTTVYNFECTENHTYIANNICVHNCYQCSKSTRVMKFEDAKKCVDDLLAGKYEYLNPGFAKAIIIEFIGGEPLLEVELVQKIYEYFLQECYRLDHPWLMFHRVSICSNGLLYFNKLSQQFLEKYARSISFNISIDGNKELHDSARVQPSGEGSYDIGIAGVHDYTSRLLMRHSSKMTLAPSNIDYIYDSIVSLITEHGYHCISLNVVFEEGWTIDDSKKVYTQLKRVADFLVDTDRPHIGLSIFHTYPDIKEDKYNNMTNVCGGNGAMLALDSTGTFFPCIRYMETSLKGDQKPITMGKLSDDMVMSDRETRILSEMDRLTRMSQQNDRCISCGINGKCNFCSGYNYQINGTVNIRTTYICKPKMAEHLASVYYWGRLAEKYPGYGIERLPLMLPIELATEIVTKEEYDDLIRYSSNFIKV